jgi:enamine deaminase RidA (YjgF/YER057c/UK114 family)|tara:strand:- start:479 stop:865 length:387 start_codon:yes stop_codon:yes gene_type:complete
VDLTPVRPDGIAPPAAHYAHGVLADGPQQLLHTSGVVPVGPDGVVPEGIAAQAEVVWSNLAAILDEAGLGMADVVSVTTYVVPGQDLAPVMAARDQALSGHLAASTLVVVAELAQPSWKIEVAVVAAR